MVLNAPMLAEGVIKHHLSRSRAKTFWNLPRDGALPGIPISLTSCPLHGKRSSGRTLRGAAYLPIPHNVLRHGRCVGTGSLWDAVGGGESGSTVSNALSCFLSLGSQRHRRSDSPNHFIIVPSGDSRPCAHADPRGTRRPEPPSEASKDRYVPPTRRGTEPRGGFATTSKPGISMRWEPGT